VDIKKQLGKGVSGAGKGSGQGRTGDGTQCPGSVKKDSATRRTGMSKKSGGPREKGVGGGAKKGGLTPEKVGGGGYCRTPKKNEGQDVGNGPHKVVGRQHVWWPPWESAAQSPAQKDWGRLTMVTKGGNQVKWKGGGGERTRFVTTDRVNDRFTSRWGG